MLLHNSVSACFFTKTIVFPGVLLLVKYIKVSSQLFIHYLVDNDDVHVSKKDGSTLVNCDSECPIPSLMCRSPSSRCKMEGILQVCDEVLDDALVARWCVYEMGDESIQELCPDDCHHSGIDIVNMMLKQGSGRWKGSSYYNYNFNNEIFSSWF